MMNICKKKVGQIIALKPLGNMTKMSDSGVKSFLKYHETKIFVNLPVNAQDSKG